MKKKKVIQNLEKKEKLKIVAMTKIIGGQAEDGGICMIENVSNSVHEDDGGLCMVDNIGA